jgi:hypothetical protein
MYPGYWLADSSPFNDEHWGLTKVCSSGIDPVVSVYVRLVAFNDMEGKLMEFAPSPMPIALDR